MGEEKILKSVLREWQKELMEYRQSGKNKKEWCSERVIPLSTFNGWLAREKKNSKKATVKKDIEKDRFFDMENKVEKSPKWIRADVLKDNFSERTTPITVKIGGFGVLVEKNFDRAVLFEVLSTLKELC